MNIRYSAGDQLWHWGQVGLVLALLLTGAAVHWPDAIPGLGFTPAIGLHEALAYGLLILLAFGLLRSGLRGRGDPWTGADHTPPPSRDLMTLALLVVRYRGGTHPLEEGGRAFMTPWHKRFYAIALGGLLPLQVMTGVGLLILRKAPFLPGTALVVGLHVLAAWFTVAFLVAHVYGATLRHQPLASLRAMVMPPRRIAASEPTSARQQTPSTASVPTPGK